MKRRRFLGVTLASALLAPVQVFAAIWNKKAFNATDIGEAEGSLSIADEIPSKDIDITAPSRAENGAIVQVAVNSHIPNSEAIAIFVDKNPTALIGNTMFSRGASANMVTRIKMAETSDIKVVVKAENRYYTASKKVIVLEGGCGDATSANEPFKSRIKIHAKQLKGSTAVQVKAIIMHPMHTGRGKDSSGKLIPAHFVQLASVRLNDQPAVDMQLSTGIAKNPYLTLHLDDAQLGDTVTVEWHDNLGNTGKAETKVIA